jgi:hypothetical protein
MGPSNQEYGMYAQALDRDSTLSHQKVMQLVSSGDLKAMMCHQQRCTSAEQKSSLCRLRLVQSESLKMNAAPCCNTCDL